MCGLVAGLVAGLAGGPGRLARADVITIKHDPLRTGWDPNEPALSPAEVSSATFGRLFSTSVVGQVYAQPLVAAGRVLVATEKNYVYSLNAVSGAQNWRLSLGRSWPSSAAKCGDLTPDVGVTSTPVYDPKTGTLYVTAVVNDGPSVLRPNVYLFAIDARRGKVNWRVRIQGAPVNDPKQRFNPFTARQRAGLLMLGGDVYIGFASYCDHGPYVGYVAGVNTGTHAVKLWSSEAGLPSGRAGIWQSGGGLMSDGPGRIFFATGNGRSPAIGPGMTPRTHLGDSVVRLARQPNGSLLMKDFFSPVNAPLLDQHDQDFGSGGPVGLPFGTSVYPHLLVQAGKDGRIFLLNRDSLGGRGDRPGQTDNAVYVTPVPYRGQFGHPAAFAGSGGNDFIYYVGGHDYMRALRLDATNPAMPTLVDTATSPAIFGGGSGSPVVTSDGSGPASAIVWEVYSSGSAGTGGMLEAFDALPQGGKLKMIWSAPIGTASKFSVPATDSGRVYVGTRDGKVLGFGNTGA